MTTSPGSDVCGLFCVKEGGASSACAALLVTSRLGTADRQLQPVGQHPAVLLADCSRVSAVAGRRQDDRYRIIGIGAHCDPPAHVSTLLNPPGFRTVPPTTVKAWSRQRPVAHIDLLTEPQLEGEGVLSVGGIRPRTQSAGQWKLLTTAQSPQPYCDFFLPRTAVYRRRQANATTMTTAKTATAPIRAINPSGGPSSGSGAGGAVAVAVGVGMGSVIGPRVGCSTTGSRVGSTWTTPQYPA